MILICQLFHLNDHLIFLLFYCFSLDLFLDHTLLNVLIFLLCHHHLHSHSHSHFHSHFHFHFLFLLLIFCFLFLLLIFNFLFLLLIFHFHLLMTLVFYQLKLYLTNLWINLIIIFVQGQAFYVLFLHFLFCLMYLNVF